MLQWVDPSVNRVVTTKIPSRDLFIAGIISRMSGSVKQYCAIFGVQRSHPFYGVNRFVKNCALTPKVRERLFQICNNSERKFLSKIDVDIWLVRTEFMYLEFDAIKNIYSISRKEISSDFVKFTQGALTQQRTRQAARKMIAPSAYDIFTINGLDDDTPPAEKPEKTESKPLGYVWVAVDYKFEGQKKPKSEPNQESGLVRVLRKPTE